MTALYMQIMGSVAAIAAASIFFFDKRQREHNKLACAVAWLMFCLYGSLAIAAWFRLAMLADWLLLIMLAINAIHLVIVKGNVSKILPDKLQAYFCQKPSLPDPIKPSSTIHRRHKRRHRYVNQGEQNATHGQ